MPTQSDDQTSNSFWTQQDYQIFNDDAGINVATSKAAKNAAASVQLNTVARIRLSVQETSNESSGAIRYALEFRVNGGAWSLVDNVSETFINIVNSSFFTDGAVTSQRLGATAFVAGSGISVNRNSILITLTSTSGNPIQTEEEWCLNFPFGG